MATPGGEIGGASAVLGQVAFVKLAPQFKDPKWREVLIISSGSSSGWCRAAVRAVNRQEIDEGLSSVKVGGETFFVLECPIHQLRVGCDERCLKLRAESSEIMSAVRELLTSGESDLQFATASEPSSCGESRRVFFFKQFGQQRPGSRKPKRIGKAVVLAQKSCKRQKQDIESQNVFPYWRKSQKRKRSLGWIMLNCWKG